MNRSRFSAFYLFIILLGFATSSRAATPKANPSRQLVIAIDIPAPAAHVWEALSTTAGLETWLAPDCNVELQKGGPWLVNFPGGSTGGGTIISFVPQKELVLSALAPDQFPNVRAQRTTARFELEPHGNSTTLRLTQTGWQQGEEWDRAYEYLTAGNAQLLAALHRRFIKGPADWNKK